MKIGIEAQRIFRKKKHGMDIVALELIRHLQQLDKTNQYYVFVKDDDDKTILRESDNVKIVTIKSAPYPYWEQVLLPEAVKKYNVDVLHCTSNTAPLRCNVPLVVTIHDIIYLEQWNFTKGSKYQIAGNLYRRWNVPLIAKKAAGVITVSNFERETIRDHFPFLKERVSTVYNGVGTHFKRVSDESVLSQIKRKYNLPDQFALCLGNKDPKKNIQRLLESISLLRKQSSLKFKLVMLDTDQSFLERSALNISDPELVTSVVPIAYVPNTELPAFYSMATMFIYPSLRESFGIPILEAMACGTPVITSNTSSMPEIAGGAALLIDPFKAETIAEGLGILWDDEEKRKVLTEKGLIQSTAFSWQQNAMQTLRIYENIK